MEKEKKYLYIVVIGIIAMIIIFGLIVPYFEKNTEIFNKNISLQEYEDRIYRLTDEDTLSDSQVIEYINLVKYMQDEYGIYTKEDLDNIFKAKQEANEQSDDVVVFTDGPSN